MSKAELVDDLIKIGKGNRQLDERIHQALGWVKYEEMDECSAYTPGAQFSPGLDCYMVPICYYFPPDLRQRWEKMYRDEGEVIPEWNEDKAKDWWIGDERDEQYPLHYTTSIDAAFSILPKGIEFAIAGIENRFSMSLFENHKIYYSVANTLPLVICIVALELREREKNSGQS